MHRYRLAAYLRRQVDKDRVVTGLRPVGRARGPSPRWTSLMAMADSGHTNRPPRPSLRCNPQRPFASNKTGASNVILRSDGVAASLHVPARGFRYMAGSSRRSLFLIVFVLATFGLLGMLFAQRISPATAPSSDSDVRDS